MVSFGRIVAAFLVMMVVGYLAIVVALPTPAVNGWQPAEMSGASAAVRLSQEAQALTSHRPVASLP